MDVEDSEDRRVDPTPKWEGKSGVKKKLLNAKFFCELITIYSKNPYYFGDPFLRCVGGINSEKRRSFIQKYIWCCQDKFGRSREN